MLIKSTRDLQLARARSFQMEDRYPSRVPRQAAAPELKSIICLMGSFLEMLIDHIKIYMLEKDLGVFKYTPTAWCGRPSTH